MQRITVLVADDSEFWRRHLPPALESDPAIRVVGTASGVKSGVGRYSSLRPDVVVADLFLGGESRNLARILVRDHHACLVGTGPASREREVASGACELGVCPALKPPAMVCAGLGVFTRELISMIKAAHDSFMDSGDVPSPSVFSGPFGRRWTDSCRLVALAASTGGTQALEDVLSGLPANFPAGIVMVQHLSHGLAEAMAERLDARSPLEVKVIDRPRSVLPGRALLAADGRHAVVRIGPLGLTAFPDDAPQLTLYRPSADVLFSSAAQACGARTIGVMLSGMGDDGCRGLQKIKERGGVVLAQDADSSVVFGMPGAAISCGAADVAVPLDEIAAELIARCSLPDPAFSLS